MHGFTVATLYLIVGGLLDAISQDLSRFTQGAEQADDITLVALKVIQ